MIATGIRVPQEIWSQLRERDAGGSDEPQNGVQGAEVPYCSSRHCFYADPGLNEICKQLQWPKDRPALTREAMQGFAKVVGGV